VTRARPYLDRPLDDSESLMPDLQRVAARRNVGQLVAARSIGDGDVRMLRDDDIAVHPGMLSGAVDLEDAGLRQLFAHLLARGQRAVEERRPSRQRRSCGEMLNRVLVGDYQPLTRTGGEDMGHEAAPMLLDQVVDLLLDGLPVRHALERHDRVANLLLGSQNQRLVGHRRAAGPLVVDHLPRVDARRRSLETRAPTDRRATLDLDALIGIRARRDEQQAEKNLEMTKRHSHGLSSGLSRSRGKPRATNRTREIKDFAERGLLEGREQ
jgi:hypothetical protein